MSRRGKDRRTQAPQFMVSLETWNKFQRFCQAEGKLDEGIADLLRSYDDHVAYLGARYGSEPPSDDFDEAVARVRHLTRFVEFGDGHDRKKKKRDNFVVYPKPKPPPKGAKVAVIVIEDISDGFL